MPGEAFDKSAKIWPSYPGGPLVDQHAQLGNPSICIYQT
jgi:tRNA A37 threonylcarbamoyltransferase TsaD